MMNAETKVVALGNGKLAIVRPAKLTTYGVVHYGHKNDVNQIVVLCGKTAPTKSKGVLYPSHVSVTCKTCPAKFAAMPKTVNMVKPQGPAAITFPTVAIQQAPLPTGKSSYGGSVLFPKNHQTAVFVDATSRAIKDKNFKERTNKFLSSVNKPETMKADVFMLRDRIVRSIVPGEMIQMWNNDDKSSKDTLNLALAQKYASEHGYTTFIFLSPAPHPLPLDAAETTDG